MGAPPSSPSPPVSTAQAGYILFLLLIGLIAAGLVGYRLMERFNLVPSSLALWVQVALVIGLGFVAIQVFRPVVSAAVRRWGNPRRSSLLLSFYSVIAYVVLVVAVLLVMGVNTIALIAGGTFAGLVLGLASQTVLSNVIAGIFLLFVAPFSPGDRITVTTWQYALLAPTYPPKFYSQDTLVPGYTGTVTGIGITYTSMRLDDGTTFKVPNNILVQAAVISHETRERWIRLKYEVPHSVPPETLLPRLTQAIRRSHWISTPESVSVLVNQATMNSYVISVDALCRGSFEEPPRSALLLLTMKIVREMPPSQRSQVPQ